VSQQRIDAGYATNYVPFSNNRRNSLRVVECECGWTGPLCKAVHEYRGDQQGEAEAVDLCPCCREEVS